jgi:hypothetical protein
MRHERNNPKGALAAFQSAVGAGPSSLLPFAQLLLGAALETNGELHQARGVYELAAASSDCAVADQAKKLLVKGK